MKLLVLGCGGIGSWFVQELCAAVEHEQVPPDTEIFVADNDMVELEQINFQNFDMHDAGMNKAQAMAQTFSAFGVTDVQKRITKLEELKPYDFVVLCVDNEPTRALVITHCFAKKKQFLDLRASGRKILAIPKMATKEASLKYVEPRDTANYSCQNAENFKKGQLDLGNKVAALVGMQMLLNHLRGLQNRPISLMI